MIEPRFYPVIGLFLATVLAGQPRADTKPADAGKSDEAVGPPLTPAFNDYVRRELKYESDIPYENVEIKTWDFGGAATGFLNTAEDLMKAMTRNLYLKVWVTCSYYDLAMPFFGAENIVAAMNLDPSVRSNIRFTYYESGHMLYIHASSRVKFKADFVRFLGDATSQAVVHSAARLDAPPPH